MKFKRHEALLIKDFYRIQISEIDEWELKIGKGI
jgi:hypothetical protein